MFQLTFYAMDVFLILRSGDEVSFVLTAVVKIPFCRMGYVCCAIDVTPHESNFYCEAESCCWAWKVSIAGGDRTASPPPNRAHSWLHGSDLGYLTGWLPRV